MVVFPITKACLYVSDGLGAVGLELTRQIKFTPFKLGPQEVRVDIEQDDVTESSLKVGKLEGNCVVEDVRLSTKLTPFEDRIRASPRGAVLYDQYLDLVRAKMTVCAKSVRSQSLLDDLHTLNAQLTTRLAESAQNDPAAYVNALVEYSGAEGVGGESTSRLNETLFSLKKEEETLNLRLERLAQELRDFVNSRCKPYDFPDVTVAPEGDAWQQLHRYLCQSLTRRRTVTQTTVEVAVNCQEVSEPVTLELSYASQNGGVWNAAYELHVQTSNPEELGVSFFAQILQRSCEDWDNVSVTLSSSAFSSRGSPPEFRPQIVRPEAPKVFAMRAAHTCGFTSTKKKVAMRRAVPTPTTCMHAAYTLAEKVSVPTDQSTLSKFLITEETLPIKSVYFCSPEVDPVVYRACRLRNSSGYHLTPGEVCSVFVDGCLSGRLEFPEIPVGASASLFLCQVEKLKVKVNPARNHLVTGGGIMSQADKLKYERFVTVHNYDTAPAEIWLAFNLIEAQDDQIKVTVERMTDLTELEADDDLAILDATKRPKASRENIKWIYNTLTKSCIAILVVDPLQSREVVFSTVLESPNGRVVKITPLR
eukprot:Gregarina_sp_Pseudo_9__6@NODE_1004_length_1979_cov_12_152062_g941_i0_p1_GENE_NODE_1004_length_1979_cov_12_152062_g941_i0NODE_1004_length_1979_cov_12_152062_g941_i0_p1_ORF_typecomplete_len591_score120_23DUF4139/PF13598_6/2e36COG2/PF06148_11/0_0012DUF4140/PF13600_6/0_0039AAA_25/PF13481_6/5_4e03AAA_25/PF13481_6/0_14SlyX/PF04102_12/1_4e02SlyX/PF04102_12/5_6SlyX/PF04102_12/1_4e03_NODE_1004_length_1979_cov_12_152062_g941_i0761848